MLNARLLLAGANLLFCVVDPGFAQDRGAPDPAPQSREAPAEAREPAEEKPAPARPGKKQEVEAVVVKAQRLTATDERRESTAAKLIVAREEIEKYGDAALVDVLRRLPGVTVSNGAVSLRGMGAAYTQFLIDGERVAPGFSIEQISPEQVERIEIIRAPTAETGARAIAGTINIILRKPRSKKQDDFKAGVRSEHGKVGGDASLSRSDALGASGNYSLTITARDSPWRYESLSRNTNINLPSNAPALDQLVASRGENDSWNCTANAQRQWKWGDGEQFTLQPFLSRSHFGSVSQDALTQFVGTPPYASSDGHFAGYFSVARFTAALTRRLDADSTYEMRAGAGRVERHLNFGDRQFDANHRPGTVQATDNHSHDLSWNASAKLTHSFSETNKFIAGAEVEAVRRVDSSVVLLNGAAQLADFGSALNLSTRRQALYAQDEWDPAANWSANAGARWEGIVTKSNVGADAGSAVDNHSSIFSPLAHIVWRVNAPKKDQIRLSLTQSYQSPPLYTLVPRPRLDSTYPVPGPNIAANPDYAGNPNLKPERANGIDLAFEHYPEGGGVIAVNFFSRRIRDLVRGVTQLETVSWATSPRYVYRSRNLGNAVSKGVEFDVKVKLSEWIKGAAPVELRANLSLFSSRVDSVRGPNNRLNDQPRGKANVGADYKIADTAFTIGGTVAYTPAYTIQNTDAQVSANAASRTIDAYLLWALSPANKLRLTVSNLAPIDGRNSTAFLTDTQLQSSAYTNRSYAAIALRLEMRL